MSEQEPLSPKGAILFGLVVVAAGIGIVLTGFGVLPAGRKLLFRRSGRRAARGSL